MFLHRNIKNVFAFEENNKDQSISWHVFNLTRDWKINENEDENWDVCKVETIK